MAGQTNKHNKQRAMAFFFVIILSAVVFAGFNISSGAITGLAVLGGPAFSADFEAGRPDNVKMPAGFYLKHEHRLFYAPDADDTDPGYYVADAQGRGVHGNAMLVDTAKLVSRDEKLDNWIESATISVEPDSTHTVSFSENYMRSGGDTDFATVQLQQFDENFLGLDSDDLVNFDNVSVWASGLAIVQSQKAGQWKKVSVTFTTLPQTRFIKFKLTGNFPANNGRDSFLIDDFTFS
ncbi:MAG: hypothetical protein HY438_00310 [DPANN group archaeon]|nr:hypothetical protein [DPANN group archaeon]